MTRLALTADLSEEHVLIQRMLDALKVLRTDPSAARGELLELLAAFRLIVGDLHHHKEEEILFPALLKSAPLARGGPRCGHFMMHPLGYDFLREAQGQNIVLPPPSPFVARVFELNSSLTIPLNEHLATKRALDLIARELDTPSGEPHAFYLLCSRFDMTMRLHIEKEDTCLFAIADCYIPSEEQERLLTEVPQDHREKMDATRARLQRLLAYAAG